MVEIEISTIPDAEIDLTVMRSLLEEFSSQSGVKVKLDTMTWGTAWTDFITIASHGKGPDISHIGGTWVGSLAIMNALRPFSTRDIEEMGGARAFLNPTWQSSLLEGDERVWAVPWPGYTYVVCYRKDLLGQLGIDGETAFGTTETLASTVHQLERSSLEIPWLIPSAPAPYSDLVHMAASFIWASWVLTAASAWPTPAPTARKATWCSSGPGPGCYARSTKIPSAIRPSIGASSGTCTRRATQPERIKMGTFG